MLRVTIVLEEMTQVLGLQPGDLSLTQFPGGYSNLTYLLKAGDKEWVLRKPPAGVQIKSAHDMTREARVLQTVRPHFAKVPQVLLIGADYYLMEHMRGTILRGEPPAHFDFATLSENFVDTLAEIHSVGALEGLGKPEGYVERQVTGWGERYSKAKTDDAPGHDQVMEYLQTHQPKTQAATLIHNDYKYDNLVLQSAQIAGVLDWEMATVGDPLMDLGCSLGYWVQPGDPAVLQATRLCCTHAPGNMTRRQLVDRYQEKTGRTYEPFYYAFGLFKIAVIAQQLYKRYRDGQSNDPRFAKIGKAVAGFIQMAEHVGKTGTLEFR